MEVVRLGSEDTTSPCRLQVTETGRSPLFILHITAAVSPWFTGAEPKENGTISGGSKHLKFYQIRGNSSGCVVWMNWSRKPIEARNANKKLNSIDQTAEMCTGWEIISTTPLAETALYSLCWDIFFAPANIIDIYIRRAFSWSWEKFTDVLFLIKACFLFPTMTGRDSNLRHNIVFVGCWVALLTGLTPILWYQIKYI